MALSVCKEVCARANKPMSKMDHTGNCRPRREYVINTDIRVADKLDRNTKRQTSGLRSFSSLYRLRTLFSNKSSSRPQPSEKDAYSPEDAATEMQDIAVDKGEKNIMQQVISIRDRVRVALPDQGFPYLFGDTSDAFCFLLGTLVCPPLIWLACQSLNLEPPSALDERIMGIIPVRATLIKVLSRHTIMALITMTSSITISTGALTVPGWKSCTRGRSSAFVSCWLLIVAGSLVWSHMGGLIAGLFLVFMTFALSVGVALSLLWYKRMSHAR